MTQGKAGGALSRLAGWIDDLLFPQDVCCLCCGAGLGGEEELLCAACADALETLEARQAESARADDRPLPPGVGALCSLYPYEGQAKRLIRALKFGCVRRAALPLARGMAMLPTGEADLLVPIPTTKRRLRRRGFNQSELLAREIGRITGMETLCALKRRDDRAAQSSLPGRLRQGNLVGCMEASGEARGKRVLLVDDVYTTGATAAEAARALLGAGAVSVAMVTAARAMPDSGRVPLFLRLWGRMFPGVGSIAKNF